MKTTANRGTNPKYGVKNPKFGVSSAKFGVKNPKFDVVLPQILGLERQVWR